MTQVRSIFLSDLHLGRRACQAQRLPDFLRLYECQHLFLVGDVIDFWAMNRRGVHWSSQRNTFVQKVLKRARHGTEVIFVPGNHDEALREYVGSTLGDIAIHREYVHVTADGKRYLLLHGDEFDVVTKYHKWLAILGDHTYAFLVRVNMMLSWLRSTLGISGYWSLGGYARRQVKQAVNFICDFEASVVHNVKHRGLDGVICGHIHAAALKQIDGVIYMSCGAWTAARPSSSTWTDAWNWWSGASGRPRTAHRPRRLLLPSVRRCRPTGAAGRALVREPA